MSAINPFRNTIQALKELATFDSTSTGAPKKVFLRIEYTTDGECYLKAVADVDVGCWESFLGNFNYRNISNINLKWVVNLLRQRDYHHQIADNMSDADWESVNTAVDRLNERVDRYNTFGVRPYYKSLRLTELRRFSVPTDVTARLQKAVDALSPRSQAGTPTPSSSSTTTFLSSASSSTASSTVRATDAASASTASESVPVAKRPVAAPTIYATMDPAQAKDLLGREIAEITARLRAMRVIVERDVLAYRERFTSVTNGMRDAFKSTPPVDLKASYDFLQEYLSACELALKAKDYTFSYIYDKADCQIKPRSSGLMNSFSVALDLPDAARAKALKPAAADSYTQDELRQLVAKHFETNYQTDSKLRVLLVASVLDQNRSLDRAVVENFTALDTLFKEVNTSLKYRKSSDDHKTALANMYAKEFAAMRAMVTSGRYEASHITALQKMKVALVPRLEKFLDRAFRSFADVQPLKGEVVALREALSTLQTAQKSAKSLTVDAYLVKLINFNEKIAALANKPAVAGSEVSAKPAEAARKLGQFISALMEFEASLAQVRQVKFDDADMGAAMAEYVKRDKEGSTWPSLAHIYALSQIFSVKVVLSQKMAGTRTEDVVVAPYLPVIEAPRAVVQLNLVNHQTFELHTETRNDSDEDEVEQAVGADSDAAAVLSPARSASSTPAPQVAAAVASTPSATRAAADAAMRAMSPVNVPPTPMGLAAFPLSPTTAQQASASSVSASSAAASTAPARASYAEVAAGSTGQATSAAASAKAPAVVVAKK